MCIVPTVLRTRVSIFLSMLGLLLSFACNSPEQSCEPSEVRACLCDNGSTGKQFCASSDQIWENCSCDQPVDAGIGDSGVVQSDGGEMPMMPLDAGTISSTQGRTLYEMNCAGCHLKSGAGNNSTRDFREDVRAYTVYRIVEVILLGEDDMPPVPMSRDDAVIVAIWVKDRFAEK